MINNPLLMADGYKQGHFAQYPSGISEVYANLTARSSKLAVTSSMYDDKVVVFGIKYFIKDYIEKTWNQGFFKKEKQEVIGKYKKIMESYLGDINTSHIEALHDLGYLPLEIKAIDELERVNIGVPILTVKNTKPEFFWLTNFIETALSNYLWKPITSATTAFEYRRVLDYFADKTSDDSAFVDYQAHDFSYRGMGSNQDAMASAAAHLQFFKGTDTVSAIQFLEEYYDTDSGACSVPATEHSVMCSGGKDTEIETFRRLIEDVYPNGIVSIVSDTWDLWKVLDEYLPQLKDLILSRDGKVVIRPDSGDPEEIIMKSLEKLWNVFGGSVNNKGYKVLNPCIGLIYGDSITIKRAESILSSMEQAGFSSENVVFGVGSYSYQYTTRDSYGFAVKATSVVINGERHDIFKDPITDDGTKKSAKGLLKVHKSGDDFVLIEGCESGGELKVVYSRD